jgi:hypothetical protein
MRRFCYPLSGRGIFGKSPRHTDVMASLLNSRRGRPSKGERHPFTVKLDMKRAVKLVELLGILESSGVEYLTPIIEKHLDAIDLDELRSQPRERRTTTVENSTTSTARTP